MPLFVAQRSLYEVRERPSKAYSWKAFLIAQVIVEIPYMIITGVLIFGCYFYAVVGVPSSLTQGTVLLLCVQFFIYASTFGQMAIAALPDAQSASAIVVLLFAMSLTFCGVMQPPSALPGFWIFMYRVSPFTYWTSAMSSTQVHGRQVICSIDELSIFNPPAGLTCWEYLKDYATAAGGQVLNKAATSNCEYCPVTVADQYIAQSNMYYSQRWRNYGLVWVYIVFNIFIAVLTYYLFRVRRWNVEGIKKSLARFIPSKKSSD